MNMGGMQMTEGATYEPTRTDDPPGTTRTRSATENLRAGKVSLSTNDSAASPISVNSPMRNPNKMPCFTHAFTTQWLPCFSAARTLPCVRASRNSRKISRTSGFCSTSPMEARRSMAVFRDCIFRKYKGSGIVDVVHPYLSVHEEAMLGMEMFRVFEEDLRGAGLSTPFGWRLTRSR